MVKGVFSWFSFPYNYPLQSSCILCGKRKYGDLGVNFLLIVLDWKWNELCHYSAHLYVLPKSRTATRSHIFLSPCLLLGREPCKAKKSSAGGPCAKDRVSEIETTDVFHKQSPYRTPKVQTHIIGAVIFLIDFSGNHLPDNRNFAGASRTMNK